MSVEKATETVETDKTIVKKTQKETSSSSSFAIPILIALIAVSLGASLYVWSLIEGKKEASYRARLKKKDIFQPIEPSTDNKDAIIQTTAKAVPFDTNIKWELVKTEDAHRAGFIAFNYTASSATLGSADLASAAAAAPSARLLSSGSADTSPEEEKLADEYIKNNFAQSPEDLALTKCDNGSNAMFFSSTRYPNGTILEPEMGGGYCINKCEYQRTLPKSKFINNKDADGKYRVDYELVLWIDPAHNSEGFAWYCRPLPNIKYDGVGWIASDDGIYRRREISPIFYEEIDDPWQRSRDAPRGFGWHMCSDPNIPIPSSRELNGGIYKNPVGMGKRWAGQVMEGNKVMPIGNDKKDYWLSDFQMVGRYCVWVGHDDYQGGDNGAKNDNYHGNFARVPLQFCPRDAKTPDGQKYDFILTPDKLSCYFCPRTYEYDEKSKVVREYMTYLRGNETDGYTCVRHCPEGMRDDMSGPLNFCIPIGIKIDPIPPKMIIELPSGAAGGNGDGDGDGAGAST